jgi:hypothetical protein
MLLCRGFALLNLVSSEEEHVDPIDIKVSKIGIA